MADVFLLFVDEDKDRAAAIRQSLVAQEGPDGQKISVWPEISASAARPNADELKRQLKQAKCLCVIWSKHSVDDYVLEDLAPEALKDNKLCSVIFDQISLRRGYYKPKNDVVDLSGWVPGNADRSFREFIDVIRLRLELDPPIKPPKPPRPSILKRAMTGLFVLAAALAVVLGLIYAVPPLIELARDDGNGNDVVVDRPTRPPPRNEKPNGSNKPDSSDGYIQDCTGCPKLVTVSSGRFRMGEPDAFGYANSLPLHDVRIQNGFAVGVFEVTYKEWQVCVNDGVCAQARAGHGVDPERNEDAGNHPVTGINWHQAKDYVDWLGDVTGKPYRLLTEAEWEYVARAGTKTSYHFGNEDARLCDYGNGRDLSVLYTNERNEKCYDRFAGATAPVGSFRANQFGLFDMHGNVWEWVEDCYQPNYEGAPSTARAWMMGDCRERVIRGGSWDSKPAHLRSAYRGRREAHTRGNTIGFRVARGLN